MSALPRLVGCCLAGCAGAGIGCPSDSTPRGAETMLVVSGIAAAPVALRAADLAAMPKTTLTQRLSVSATAASAGAATERSTSFAGPLLRELLLAQGYGGPNDRAARFSWVEAVASDGYRAIFSWGELFNSALGDQVQVVTTIDGRALDAAAGPLALRSLADLRPGPRHVRNLCALVIHR